VIEAVVTGAEGFIGRALIGRLQTLQYAKVISVSRRDGDVSEAELWNKLPPAKIVFHLAGRSYVPESWENGADFLKTNVIGTQRALDYCRRHGASMVLASAYVYGTPERLPIHEEDPARPSNPYALSKLMAEELCEFAHRSHGVSTTILRLFNVYGPGQRSDFLIPSILRQLSQGQEIRVLTLTPRRDYVFLDDVVDAFVCATKAPKGLHRVNIGSGTTYSVAEVVDVIQDVAGASLRVSSANTDRIQEVPETQAAITLAAGVLEWSPKWSFRGGIRKTIEGSES
jgi:GDP-4-dehydro-6-deoxy-D-mannose reductase